KCRAKTQRRSLSSPLALIGQLLLRGDPCEDNSEGAQHHPAARSGHDLDLFPLSDRQCPDSAGAPMFGMNNRREVERVLCRLLSRSAFERLDTRGESRSCQVLPVLLAPDVDGEPGAGEPTFGLITDLSSKGVGVYVQRLISAEHLFLGMLLDAEAHVLRG